jgi:chaperonin GroEL
VQLELVGDETGLSASVAGLLVTTEAMVAEKPEKKTPPAMPGGGGMGGMDY